VGAVATVATGGARQPVGIVRKSLPQKQRLKPFSNTGLGKADVSWMI
jgi:hypothetical protein